MVHLLAGAGLLAVVAQSMALLSLHAGAFHDDGVYLVTARALAEHGRYWIESLPQPIAQTKYPVLFPALLAAVWKVAPDFPGNLPLLRLVPLTAFWLWIALLWRIAAVELKRPIEAGAIIVLVLVSPASTFFATQLLSETVFAALCTWAVLLLMRIERAGAPASTGSAIAAALVCALAFHTRTIGITLLVPAVVALWLKPVIVRTAARGSRDGLALVFRSYTRPALVFAVTWIALCAPWYVWQWSHAAPADPVLAYYTHANYASWNLLSALQSGRAIDVIGQNLVHLMLVPFWLWAVPPAGGGIVLLSGLVVGAVSAIAMLRAVRGRMLTPVMWAAATIVVTLLWAWPPARFLFPVAPLILLAVLMTVAGWRYGMVKRAGAITLAVVALCGAVQTVRLAAATATGRLPWVSPGATTWAADLHEAAEWVERNTPEDAIIAANLDPTYSLYARRSAVRAFAADPIRLFYDPSAPAGATGDADALLQLLVRHEASYLLVEDIPFFTETIPLRQQVAALAREHAGVLSREWTSAHGSVMAYRVDAMRLAEAADGRRVR